MIGSQPLGLGNVMDDRVDLRRAAPGHFLLKVGHVTMDAVMYTDASTS